MASLDRMEDFVLGCWVVCAVCRESGWWQCRCQLESLRPVSAEGGGANLLPFFCYGNACDYLAEGEDARCVLGSFSGLETWWFVGMGWRLGWR